MREETEPLTKKLAKPFRAQPAGNLRLCRDLAGKCGNPALPFLGIINAGWPSPAEEELLDTISFDDWLIEDSSFMVKVQSDAMQDAGIHTGDVVIFRRGQKPKPGDIVIAEIDNEWLMRYYILEDGKPALYPANGLVAPIYPEDLTIIGVIRSVIRKY